MIKPAVALSMFALFSVPCDAATFNFSWSGNPLNDLSIVGSDDPTLSAVGTIEIDAAPGASFSLADIVATNILVTGSQISSFVISTWASAGGMIAADGLSAYFVPSGDPHAANGDGNFGCEWGGCNFDNTFWTFDIIISNDRNVTPYRVLYASGSDALASMRMVVTASQVPLPAGFPLILTGLGGLILVSRRRLKLA